MHDEFMEAVKTVLNVNQNTGAGVTFTAGTVEELVARLDRYEQPHSENKDVEELLLSAKALVRTLLVLDGDTVKRAGRVISDLLALLKNVQGQYDRLSKDMPSWKDGTPEHYDAWLRGITPVDRRLKFYQWIGHQAVNEAIADVRANVGTDPTPAEFRSYTQDTVHEFLDAVQGDLYPSVLPKGRHMCDVQWHTHTNGMGYLSSCRMDPED